MARVLVVEDDREIAELVRGQLERAGFSVRVVFDGESGYADAASGGFDLVILDLMLPRMGGLEVAERLARLRAPPLILMLTARAEEVDRVLGLELGADDYLTKPFSLRELEARAKALLRRKARQERPPAEGRIAVGEIEIDPAARRVRFRGERVHLAPREFDLLLLFAQNPGRVFSRAELLERVWGPGFAGFEHTVNAHINRLRAKIEADPRRPRHLETVWGVGYRFGGEEE